MSDGNAMPRVSVVMPVFDGEAFLAEAIESILAQTLENLELVVVDDGSTDTSAEIVKRFAHEDERVRPLRNECNRGISATLNRGWRAARATYVARLDADDVALPKRLSMQADFLDAHPSVAVVGGAAIVVDQAGRRVSSMRFPTSSRAIRSTLLRHNCLAHPTVMVRRVALEDAGGYRFDHVEDYDLWLRISESNELANLAEPVLLYRFHSGQVSLRVLEDRIRRSIAVRNAARMRLESGVDLLAASGGLSESVIASLSVDEAEVARTLEHELLSWAVLSLEAGQRKDAEELVGRASRVLGRRGGRAFAAALELKRADTLLGEGRPIAALARVAVAFWREPAFSWSRATVFLRDRLPSRRAAGAA